MSVTRRTPSSRHPVPLLLVAAAGWGKSSMLESACGGPPLTATAVRADVSLLHGRDIVAIDDLDRVDTAAQAAVLSAVADLPVGVEVLLAARSRPGAAVVAKLRTPLTERNAVNLALDETAIAAVLREEHGIDNGTAPRRVRRLTAGWPALVHLAGDALATGCGNDDHALLEALAAPGRPTRTWLETHVIGTLREEARALLRATAHLDVVTPDLCRAVLGDKGWSAVFAELVTLGLMTPSTWPTTTAHRVVPAVADVVGANGQERERRALVAAGWFADHDLPLPQIRALVSAGHVDPARRLVVQRSDDALGRGGAPDVVRLLEDDPAPCPEAQLVLGDAMRIVGDAPGALRVLSSLEHDEPPAGLGWRLAGVHYMRGAYDAALEVLDRGDGGDACDEVRSLACRAHVLAVLGRADEATAAAGEALRLAESLDEARLLATAHLAMASAATGRERDSHLVRASRAAATAGDVLQHARSLVNHSCSLLAAARFEDARREARAAVDSAEAGCPPGLLTVALHNLAEAERRTGRLDEATVALRRALDLCEGQGSSRSAFGLLGLAQVDAARGMDDRAALLFRDAIAVARANGEVQVHVQALAGLAHLLCWDADTRARAAESAREAEVVTTAEFAPFAVLASGWVAHAAGDAAAAEKAAEHALSSARELGWVDLLAEALELRGATATDSQTARQALGEALSLWLDGGARPAADRVRVLLGRIADADPEARLAGRDAGGRLQRAGVGHVHGLPVHDAEGGAEVTVRLHGPFEVTVRGSSVPVQAWRSRQARALVKILAAASGRAVTRSALCHFLWPDDDPAKTGHRLSVLLSTVRLVLDPDRRWPVDRFVTADLDGLALDQRYVRVDLHRLLHDEQQAQRLLGVGELDLAEQLLADVVTWCSGPALEDERDAEWAAPARERSRAALHRCLWNLAQIHGRSGDDDRAVPLLVRLLADDPYDEQAHRALVRALVRRGRHGEARRALRRWADAMAEIDVPPPDDVVLAVVPGTHRPGAAVLTP